jgi:hypothetical protein
MEFGLGIILGLYWRELKWIFIDSVWSVGRGIYYAIKVMLFGKTAAGHKRRELILISPRIILCFIKLHLRTEWLDGGTITHRFQR